MGHREDGAIHSYIKYSKAISPPSISYDRKYPHVILLLLRFSATVHSQMCMIYNGLINNYYVIFLSRSPLILAQKSSRRLLCDGQFGEKCAIINRWNVSCADISDTANMQVKGQLC